MSFGLAYFSDISKAPLVTLGPLRMLHRQKLVKNAFANSGNPPTACTRHRLRASAFKHQPQPQPAQPLPEQGVTGALSVNRRQLLQLSLTLAATAAAPAVSAAPDDFTTLPSGLKVLDIRPGEGATPAAGDTVVVHWSGFTKGYQGKRIDNTSVRDEPYEFVLGSRQVGVGVSSRWHSRQ
jgi:hypothetical protein